MNLPCAMTRIGQTVGLLFMAAPLLAGQPRPAFTSISVTVSSRDADLRAKVKSYIERELRSLGDVLITDKNPVYELRIMSLSLGTPRGDQTGYVLTGVITMGVLLDIPQSVNKTDAEWITRQVERVREYRNTYVLVGGLDSLRELCANLVTSIDSGEFTWLRKMLEVTGPRGGTVVLPPPEPPK